MHFRRVMVEHFGQALTVGTGLLDRLVLTAVLLRTWDDSDFETWSVCVAFSGLVSLFDFGFSLYFNNRLMEETEQHRLEDARRTLRIGNTVFVTAAILGFVTIAALVAFSPSFAGIGGHSSARLVVLVLAAGSALRIAATGFHALYRAHRQYARLTFLQASADVARIAAAIAVCRLGGGVLAVTVAVTLVTVLLQIAVPVIDALRRFESGRPEFALVPKRELASIFGTSSAFFAQLIPIILLACLPVVYLGQLSVAGGMLTTFLLMRTLSGVPRALLQQFGVVLGQECGRRIAVRDNTGATMVVAEGARFYAVLSGIATGLLVGAGSEISLVWTGSSDYFRLEYVLAAVSPMLLAAFAVLAHNILVTTNAPLFGTLGRWMQLILTAFCVAVLPVSDLGLAMLLALSLGDILGFVPFAYVGVARLVPGITIWFYVRECLVSIAAAALALLITHGVLWLVGGPSVLQRLWAIALALLLNAACIPWLGVRPRTRRVFIDQFVQPRLATLGASLRG